MRTQDFGRKPGMAAPEAAAHVRPVGAASVAADAFAPAGLTPQKDSALAAQATQSREQNEHPNFDTNTVADKAFFTLRALLALKGYALNRTQAEDGPVRFYVTRWGVSRELPNLAAVRGFAEQAGAAHA